MPYTRADRIALASQKSLVFFSDQYTRARRSEPIPQLTCLGSVCKMYEPQAVECVNIGGEGVDVNWKCNADLPSSLRFGKVTVSCEGWNGSGDSNVLKGSCGLEYSLVHIPSTLDSEYGIARPPTNNLFQDPFSLVFYALFTALLIYFGWAIVRSCLSAHQEANGGGAGGGPYGNPYPGGGGGGPGGTGSWGGRGGGGHTDEGGPPPPYSSASAKADSSSAPQDPTSRGWTPGFGTGLALGGLATSLYNTFNSGPRAERRGQDESYAIRRARERLLWEEGQLRAGAGAEYDWENVRGGGFSSGFGRRRTGGVDRTSSEGAGPSRSGSSSAGLGEMRSSTAIGNSRSR